MILALYHATTILLGSASTPYFFKSHISLIFLNLFLVSEVQTTFV